MANIRSACILLLTIGLATTATVHAKSSGQAPVENFSTGTPVEAEISILRGTVTDSMKKSLLHLPMDDPDTNDNQRFVC